MNDYEEINDLAIQESIGVHQPQEKKKKQGFSQLNNSGGLVCTGAVEQKTFSSHRVCTSVFVCRNVVERCNVRLCVALRTARPSSPIECTHMFTLLKRGGIAFQCIFTRLFIDAAF